MMSAFFKSAAYIQVDFRLDFIMEAHIINPDQTAPISKESVYINDLSKQSR